MSAIEVSTFSDIDELFLWYGWPRKVFSLISNWNRCQRFSPSQIFDTPQAGLEPAQNLIQAKLNEVEQ